MTDRRFQSLSPLNMDYRVTNATAGDVTATTSRRKLAILGGSNLSRSSAPLDDPEWEVWSLNNLWPKDAKGRTRADRWFELHPMDVQSPDDMGIINSCPMPLYVLELYPEIANPNAVRFPWERLEAMEIPRFFPCTFCYQIALALADGWTEIGLFGVDLQMGSGRERALERAGVAFWLGAAMGSGVTVNLPETVKGHGLISLPYRYGYDYHEEKAWVDRWVETIGGLPVEVPYNAGIVPAGDVDVKRR